jgi:hypothetical protein
MAQHEVNHGDWDVILNEKNRQLIYSRIWLKYKDVSKRLKKC